MGGIGDDVDGANRGSSIVVLNEGRVKELWIIY